MNKHAVAQPQRTTASADTSVGSHLLRRRCACGGTPGLDGECADCHRKRLTLRRRSTNHAGHSTAPPIVNEVLRTPGQPLDPTTRVFMEVRFNHTFGRMQTQSELASGPAHVPYEQGADQTAEQILTTQPSPVLPGSGHSFAQVRIHADARAAESARAVNALAYTVGQHIVFGPGQYTPGTIEGNKLLAHELTHTIQQGSTRTALVQTKSESATKTTPSKRKKSIQKVILYVDQNRVTLIFRDGSRISLPTIYNGNPKQGKYLLHREGASGRFHNSALAKTGVSNQKGLVVEWDMPEYATFAGVDAYYLIVTSTPERARADEAESLVVGDEVTVEGTHTGSAEGDGAGAGPSAGSQEHGTPEDISDTEARAADRERIEALSEEIKALLGGEGMFQPEDYQRLLRIAAELQGLAPEDLQLYVTLARSLTHDLNLLEESIKIFKALLPTLKAAEKEQPVETEELRLELEKVWAEEGVDATKFKELHPEQKKALAQKIVAKQSTIQLQYMAKHPVETALRIARGMVRLDEASGAVTKEFLEGLSSESPLARMAHGAGTASKFTGLIAGTAFVLYVAVKFIPGLNLASLAGDLVAMAGAFAFVSILSSQAAAQLHIQAASEATSLEDFKAHTDKAAGEETNVLATLLLMIGGAGVTAALAKLLPKVLGPFRGKATELTEQDIEILESPPGAEPPPGFELQTANLRTFVSSGEAHTIAIVKTEAGYRAFYLRTGAGDLPGQPPRLEFPEAGDWAPFHGGAKVTGPMKFLQLVEKLGLTAEEVLRKYTQLKSFLESKGITMDQITKLAGEEKALWPWMIKPKGDRAGLASEWGTNVRTSYWLEKLIGGSPGVAGVVDNIKGLNDWLRSKGVDVGGGYQPGDMLDDGTVILDIP